MKPSRTHLIRSIAVVGALATSIAGCGKAAEKAAEKAVEEAIESESGENVDIDFSGDEFTLESEDGDLTMQVDEDGNVQIDGVDANGEGGSLDIGEDGSFTVTDENGEVVTGEVDEDGGNLDYTIEGEDGEARFSSSEGLPEQWPSDVPQPDGLDDLNGSYFASGSDESVVVTGTTSADPADFYDEYAAKLIDAGFEEQSKYSEANTTFGSYGRGDRTVTVNVDSLDGNESTVTIAVG